MNAHCIHKKHNAEDVRLKARPVGRCPKARLYVIASYHASFNLEAGMLLPPWMDASRTMQEQLSRNGYRGAKICQNNALILAFG